jgi:hypothetical protein
MLRKNKSTITLHDEVNIGDLISFEIDILKIKQLLWLEQWAHPSNEGA